MAKNHFQQKYPVLSFLISIVSLSYLIFVVYTLFNTSSWFWFWFSLIVLLLIPLVVYYYVTFPVIKRAREKKKNITIAF